MDRLSAGRLVPDAQYPRWVRSEVLAHQAAAGIADLTIRDVRDAAGLRACQVLQRAVWGITEDGYLLPVATMAGAQRVGGLVLGAYQGEQLIGFSFAFLGQLRGQLILYSQLTGVAPGLQRQGVGRRLKVEQRRRALALGATAVVWAFDPLQAPNATFNLHTLGAISRIYEVDLYGARTDALNLGLATDRLLAEWSTTDEHAPVEDREAPDLIECEAVPGTDQWRPGGVRDEQLGRRRLRLSIPASLAATRSVGGVELVDAWQRSVRAAFQAAFAVGYRAVGFIRVSGTLPAYVLERSA
jgi:predicted GNAT superfamily acetyltransferase